MTMPWQLCCADGLLTTHASLPHLRTVAIYALRILCIEAMAVIFRWRMGG